MEYDVCVPIQTMAMCVNHLLLFDTKPAAAVDAANREAAAPIHGTFKSTPRCDHRKHVGLNNLPWWQCFVHWMNRRVVHMKKKLFFLEPNAWEATLTGVAHKKQHQRYWESMYRFVIKSSRIFEVTVLPV